VSYIDRPPYPGMRPFERDESHLFFGRDHCVDEMVKRLAERRFLAVLGSSGTGKSSLVKTGLFSALEMGLLSGAGSHWLIVDFRPGGNALGNLARALLEAECLVTRRPGPSDAEVEPLQKRFKQQGRRELIKWCREGHLPEDTNLLVLVDQFEELFWYQNAEGREDAQALVTLLLESRWPRGLASPQRAEMPIYVTITLRSEYLGPCALIWGLPEAINEGTYLTPRMKRQECEDAILGPARVCGFDVEPQLVTRLLNDMADFAPWDIEGGKDQLTRLARGADQLPLMQHALNQMWQRAREGAQAKADDEEIVLKLADYRGLEEELDDHAEQVFASLDASCQAVAERIFRAVTQGTTVANAVRRPTRYGPSVTASGTQQPRDGQFGQGGQPHDGQPQERQPPGHQSQNEERWNGESRDSQHQDGPSQVVEVQSQVAQPNDQDNLIEICGGEQSRGAVERVMTAFGSYGCKFLTANPKPADRQPPTDNAVIDIAHESLIRQWKRLSGGTELRRKQLRGWLVEEGEAAGLWQRLVERVKKHLSGGTELREKQLRGWLVEEGEAAGLWRHLVERAKKNEWMIGRTLQEAKLFCKKNKPTPAWAQRYGGEFDLVDRFVRKSLWRERGFIGLGCIFLAIFLGFVTAGYYARQQHNVATRIFNVAVGSAQELLDVIGGQVLRGDVTTRGAEEGLQVAGAIAKKVATPENPTPLIRLAQTASDIYGDIGKYDDALAWAKQARDLADPLTAAKSNDAETMQLLYDSVWRMADAIYFRGGAKDRAALVQSLAVYTEARTLALVLMELSPNGARSRALMFIYRKTGLVHHDLRDFDTAIAEFEIALMYIERALEKEPDNRDWKRERAVTQRALARALAANGDFDHAMEQFMIAVNALTALARAEPDNAVPQSNLAAAHREIGDFYQDKKEFDEAVVEYDQAIKVQTEMNFRDPANASWIVPLARSHAQAGTALKQLGRLTDSLSHFEKAKDLREQLANKDRASHSRQNNLATAYIQFADVATEVAKIRDRAERDERFGAAVEAYRSAIDIFDVEIPRDNDSVFDSYTKIGDIRVQQGDLGKAFEAYSGASEIARAIAEKDESVVWQRRLVNSYDKIAELLAAQNRAREATDEYQKALDIVRMLAAKSQSTEWTSKADELNRKIQLTKPAQ
jgi:tetratricopeptide (TPR) repeat protein